MWGHVYGARAAYACSPGAEVLSPSPKTRVQLVLLRKLLCVMLRGCKTDLSNISLKLFSLPSRTVAFVRAKARSWKAALEKIGVVSGRKMGGT